MMEMRPRWADVAETPEKMVLNGLYGRLHGKVRENDHETGEARPIDYSKWDKSRLRFPFLCAFLRNPDPPSSATFLQYPLGGGFPAGVGGRQTWQQH